MIVVDASAALSRLMPSQATAASASFFDQRADDRLRAPFLFEAEVSNVLLRAVRQGRFDGALIEPAIADLLVAVDIEHGSPSPADLRALAVLERLSFFDACYLDLALRTTATLASRDGPLLDAARRRGLAVADLR